MLYAPAPDQTPAVLDVDPERFAFTMEDLSDLGVLRGALTRGARFGDASQQVGDLMAFVRTLPELPSARRTDER